MFIVVFLHCAVRGLVFKPAVGWNQHGCHHGQRAARWSDHIRHNVAVVIFQRPEHAAFAFHNSRHGIVDQGKEVFDASFFKFFFPVLFEFLIEDFAETGVVYFGNGVFGGEPQIDFFTQSISETSAGKAQYGLFQIIINLRDSLAREIKYRHTNGFTPILRSKDQFEFPGGRNGEFRIAVNIAVSVTPYSYRFFPWRNGRLDIID